MSMKDNIFGRRSAESESSDDYTLRSAAKFGGLRTISDRGSVAMSFKATEFKHVDPIKVNVNFSGSGSLLDMAVNQNDLERR